MLAFIFSDPGPVEESILTILGNIGGYALAVLVVVHFLRKTPGEDFVTVFPKAAAALFVLWVSVTTWYVASEAWVSSFPAHRAPDWLESSNGISENNQSEIFQIWLAAVVFKWLKWPGSPESK